MITYEREVNECSHYAISEINRIHGANISVTSGNGWQAKLIPHLLQYFTKINKPENNCLVVMSQIDGGVHMGVYRNRTVWHNYQPFDGAGSVIGSDMGTIRLEYRRIRFYKYDHNKKVHGRK